MTIETNDQTAQTESAGKKEKGDADCFVKLSLKQPVWHVIVLGVFTFKLYLIYWCYKNWRDLGAERRKSQPALSEPNLETAGVLDKDESAFAKAAGAKADSGPDSGPETRPAAGKEDSLIERCLPEHLSSFKDTSPMLRAILTVVPYLQNYMYFTLIMGIARLNPNKDSFVFKHPLISAFALVFISISCSYLAFLPKAYYLLFLLGVIPMAIAQHWLNQYFDEKEKKGLLMRHGFTVAEMVCIIAGGLYLGFLGAAFMMGRG